MTSFHRRWSNKVAIPADNTREVYHEPVGVAGCMNWNHGAKPKQTTESKETARRFVRDLSQHVAHEQIESALRSNPNRQYVDSHHEPDVVYSAPDLRVEKVSTTPTQIELTVSGRATVHTPEIGTQHQVIRRVPTPGPPTNRRTGHVQAWSDQHQPHPPQHTHREQKVHEPFKSTKTYLKRYMNRSLTDDEIKRVLADSQDRANQDMQKAIIEERMRQHLADLQNTSERYDHYTPVPPPQRNERYPQSADLARYYDRSKDVRYADEFRNSGNGYNYTNTRPTSAYRNPRERKPHVTWDITPRPPKDSPRGSQRSTDMNGRHFASWRPDTTSPAWPWTNSVKSYDELWRLASKYRDDPCDVNQTKSLGIVGTNNTRSHYDAERDYIQSRSASRHEGDLRAKPGNDQGKVNVQLDCPENTDMMVNLRIQTANGSRYN